MAARIFILNLGVVVVMTSMLMLSVVCTAEDNEVTQFNDRPIVGILSQELSTNRSDWKTYKSFIPASYIKYVESAGARVVPIWINKTRSYYENMMSKLNGVLFPGGSINFDAKYGFGDAGAMIYDIAKGFNDKGEYFPLWGTCQGFELLAFLGANRTDPLTNCNSGNVNLHLEFLPDYSISKMYALASKEIIQILSSEQVTVNFHRFCLTQENVTRYMGDINWRITTLNKDANGLTFISSMESRKYPFYGVQFHPEKPLFEWAPQLKTAHTSSAVKASQYYANFFVNEARKSHHSFSSSEEEKESLIYNFTPLYTGKEKKYFSEMVYLFEW
ncbi:Gamma-glutamyl hydrolase A [Frankliniella fusca]|uniref:folate gamma-glutamyl hydrolase n=1 Tax=Frankliniella fusca TaxID=407009 RepID=A0AAE1H9W7_9NEOP|nr:Gamma-glutamyl hydrolase A [Frankliniella fusca]